MKTINKSIVTIFFLAALFTSCATTSSIKKEPVQKLNYEDYPWSNYNTKAGSEIKMPIDGVFICYGKTNFSVEDWDYSIPKELGTKTLIIGLPYTYYFEGIKQEVFYEILISNINLKPEIAALPLYSEIKEETVIGTAAADKPGIMFRTVIERDPNLVLNGKRLPLKNGVYTYYDATTIMPSTPKFLTFMPVTSKRDQIEFWDYPETIEEINQQSLKDPDNKDHITRFPFFQIMVKTKLSEYPTQIKTKSMNDLVLHNQFFPNCDTELVTDFDTVPFHLVFQQGFDKYLQEEYKTGDDIYLYLSFLFGKNGELFFYVRDYSLNSPEEQYNDLLEAIEIKLQEKK